MPDMVFPGRLSLAAHGHFLADGVLGPTTDMLWRRRRREPW